MPLKVPNRKETQVWFKITLATMSKMHQTREGFEAGRCEETVAGTQGKR